MKYFIIILSFFLSNFCYSQTPKPFVNPRSSSTIVVQDYNLSVPSNLYIPRLNDTISSNSIDTIANLIYDRIRAKIWIRDTVLTGGHKWTQLFKQDDTISTLATKYDLTQIDASNISNASLTANGNYSQNWNNKQLSFDSIKTSLFFRGGGIGSTGTRRKEFKINWGGSSFGDALDIFSIVASIRNAASTADSIYGGMISSNSVISNGVYNTVLGNNFISYSNAGLININARDSIWIKGAQPFATADSVYAPGPIIGPNTNRLRKIPVSAIAGTTNLTYKNVGYGSIGNTLSIGESDFQYDSVINELTVDSTSAIQHRADYITLNAIAVVDTVLAFGNSITYGSAALPRTDSGYIYRTGTYLGKPVGNYAISGRGVLTAIALDFIYTPLLHYDMTVVMAAFNDIRNNNVFGATGRLTLNKIINAHKSIFANHNLKSFVPAGGASVTRYGSWAAPWDAKPEGGKTSTATYTSTTNDSLKYSFTDSTVIIGFIGQNAAAQAGSAFSIYVDGVLKATGTTDNQCDHVDDGFGGNFRIPMCEIITGLSNTAHTLKVVNNGSGVFIVDYIGHLRDAATAPPLVIMQVPYMDSTGYAFAGSSSVRATDTTNAKLDSLVNALPSAYLSKTFLVHTNNYYDTLTGLSTVDHIHPNNTGHRQIFNGIVATLSASDSKPLGSIYYSSNKLFFVDTFGIQKIILGGGAIGYISKFTADNKIASSIIQDDGTNIGVNQAPATYKLSVTGTARTTADTYLSTGSGNTTVGSTSNNGYKFDVAGTVGANGAISSYGTGSGFNLTSRQSGSFEWVLLANNSALFYYSVINSLNRIAFWRRGGISIAHNTESNLTDEYRGLSVHGSVAIDKDSVPTISSIGTNFLMAIDTANTSDSNRLKKILPSSLGFTTTSTVATQIHDSLTSNNISWGTYTPTLTNSSNIDASTAYQCQWNRVGNVVTVSGKVDIDPASATTLTVLGISLPVASAIANDYEIGGTGANHVVQGYSAAILGDATNDRALFDFTTGTDVANRSWFFSFTYLVTPP
jgi:hypothetical protein